MIHMLKENEEIIQTPEPTTLDKLQLLLVQYFQEQGLELEEAMEEAKTYLNHIQMFNRV